MPNHLYDFRFKGGFRNTAIFTLDGQVTNVFQTEPGLYSCSAVKQGSSNADWKARLERGEPVGSAYRRIAHMSIAGVPGLAYSMFWKPSSRESVTHFGVCYSQDRFSSSLSLAQSDKESVYFSATMSYSAWLAKGVGEFEGLTFLGEFPKLVASLATRTRALAEAQEYYSRKLLRHLRRSWRRYGKLQRPLKNKEKIKLKTSLSGYYLEYWFGMFPFLKSLEELHNAFEALPETQYLTVSGSSSRTRKDQSQTIGIVSGGDSTLSAVFTTRHWYGCNLKGFYSTSKVYDLRLALGFTLDDIAVTGWELVPFSWLADYWLPIGDYLSNRKYLSLQPDVLYTTYNIKRTQFVDRGIRTRRNGSNPPATYTFANIDKRARDVSTRVDRIVTYVPPTLDAACLLDMSTWGEGPNAQQRTYVAAVAATMTRRFRRLTTLL